MYRSLGSLASFGVPSGPYTGKPKRIVWNKLPREVRQRVVRALDGRGRPAPIAIDIPRPSRLVKRLVLASMVGTAALVVLVVHSWPRAQPTWFSVLFSLAVLPVALLGGLLIHRHVVRGGAPLDPGKVLFPLDLLSFDGQALTLTPLGSVRDVGVLGEEAATGRAGANETRGRGKAGELRLVLRFETGEEASFPMPSTTHADRTYAALAMAQKTLEALSYGDDLEKALEHDPFFGVRSGPDLERALAPEARARPWPLSAALLPMALLAFAFGHVAFVATGQFSDEMRFSKAFAENTESAMKDYLARGGLRVKEAEYFFGARRTERRKDLELERMRDRVARNEALKEATSASSKPKNPPGFVVPKTPEQWNLAHAECLRALKDRAPSPSKALPAIFALAEEARVGVGGPAHLEVRFERTMATDVTNGWLEAGAKGLAPLLDAREAETARALAMVLSEACPPSVLDVRLARGPSPEKSPAIVVRYEVRKPAVRAFRGRPFTLAEVRFDTTVEVWPKKPVGFSLTMPPPEEATDTTRERSVFRIDEDAPTASRVYGAFTARAFDRLYDELYGLFFRGPVKVPLPGFAEVERIFMK